MEPLWEAGEIRPAAPTPTRFPTSLPINTVRSLLYQASCRELGGAPLTRWLLGALLVLTLAWATGYLPGRWLGTVLWAALTGALALGLFLLQREDFVRFFDGKLPTVKPQRLAPEQKLPIYVTGQFSVQGRVERFTVLPGFFRTFATREHALLCRAAEENGLPEEKTGMWYVFFFPDDILAVSWGKLLFDRTLRPALALQIKSPVVRRRRLRRTPTQIETVYVVTTSEEDGRRILADLLVDLPAHAHPASQPPPAS